MSLAITFLRKLEDYHCKDHVSIFLFLQGRAGRSSYFLIFFSVQAHTADVPLMTLQLGLTWHHGGVTCGTWHVLAACWRALDVCWHIQALVEHMKAHERKVVIPSARGGA